MKQDYTPFMCEDPMHQVPGNIEPCCAFKVYKSCINCHRRFEAHELKPTKTPHGLIDQAICADCHKL